MESIINVIDIVDVDFKVLRRFIVKIIIEMVKIVGIKFRREVKVFGNY